MSQLNLKKEESESEKKTLLRKPSLKKNRSVSSNLESKNRSNKIQDKSNFNSRSEDRKFKIKNKSKTKIKSQLCKLKTSLSTAAINTFRAEKEYKKPPIIKRDEAFKNKSNLGYFFISIFFEKNIK